MNLTAVGTLDWVHWGLYTETSLNRKCCVAPEIGSYKVIGSTNGFLGVYQQTDNSNGYSWSDGEPITVVSNTPTGVWVYGRPNVASGFELGVPADTNAQTLQVFVGAYAARGSFHAFLSDGSAPVFSSTLNETVSNMGNGPGGVFTIEYAAGSTGQVLTIQWTVAQVFAPDGNVTLQAATLSAPGVNNPPFVQLTEPVNDSNFSCTEPIILTAAASDSDGTIGAVEFYAGTNKLGEATNAPYSYAWSNAAVGYYQLKAVAIDDQGGTGYSPPVEIFVFGSGGNLGARVFAPPASVDLDAEGRVDWVQWGVSNAFSFTRKNTPVEMISNFSKIGADQVSRYSDNKVAFYWTNGTPVVSAYGTTTGVFTTGITNGFQITVPADITPRRLTVYVGGYGMRGHFQAHLSDFSAAAYSDTTVSNYYGNSVAGYRLDYSAVTAGQELVVVYRSLELFDQEWGNATLQAATLQDVPPNPVTMLEPVCLGDTFNFGFLSQSNVNYQVEYSPSFSPSEWQTVASLPGTGGMLYVTNAVKAPQGFYRVLIP